MVGSVTVVSICSLLLRCKIAKPLPRGVLPEKLGRGVQSDSKYPFTTIKYLWPKSAFLTLFMTWKSSFFLETYQFKNGVKTIPLFLAKTPKSISCLWPEWLKNHTLWSHSYLSSPYKEVPPWKIAISTSVVSHEFSYLVLV